MRRIGLGGLTLMVTVACVAGAMGAMGVYDMVNYHGKPLPWEGVRRGEIHLMADHRFLYVTEQAIELGQAPSETDTVWGRYRVEGFSQGCTWLVLAPSAPTPEMERGVFAEVCEGELGMPDLGIFFERRTSKESGGGEKEISPKNTPGQNP